MERKNKTCSRCKKIKDLSEFHKLRSASDGHKSACKLCRHVERAKSWKKYKDNSTVEDRHNKYLKNKPHYDAWMANPVNKERDRINKLKRRRKIAANSTLEERRERRLKGKASYKIAKKKYRKKIKLEEQQAQIEQNKLLYQQILSEDLTHVETQLKYDISKRFLVRLLKYKGNCYKTETVIDRIKPNLDEYYGEKGEREASWSWLISPLSNYRLRVDLFYPQKNLVVEFNGPQHYREIGYKNLSDVQIRDARKYTLLKEHDINLRIITKESEVLNGPTEKI